MFAICVCKKGLYLEKLLHRRLRLYLNENISETGETSSTDGEVVN